jgi:acetyl-CoA carboxylase biotin carboxyl carrier protein
MDIRKVKKIIELIQESDISEIEIANGEENIRILRGGAVPSFVSNEPACAVPPAPVLSSDGAARTEIQEELEEDASASGHMVRSPMVGTYYEAASPGQPAFVKKGDKVNAGDTLCIIEAMKIMNQITAEKTGTIVKMYAENAQPVEYDQPLFVIE